MYCSFLSLSISISLCLTLGVVGISHHRFISCLLFSFSSSTTLLFTNNTLMCACLHKTPMYFARMQSRLIECLGNDKNYTIIRVKWKGGRFALLTNHHFTPISSSFVFKFTSIHLRTQHIHTFISVWWYITLLRSHNKARMEQKTYNAKTQYTNNKAMCLSLWSD